jgi:hypothetical protein
MKYCTDVDVEIKGRRKKAGKEYELADPKHLNNIISIRVIP